MFNLVSETNAVLISNVLLFILLCILIVIVGCALLLIFQFVCSACNCCVKVIFLPTFVVYKRFSGKLLNEQQDYSHDV
ncbi:small membrane protein [Pteropus rufus nobecovirus]|nr:small membrane protein [Pteropus rufus nobecovirus]